MVSFRIAHCSNGHFSLSDTFLSNFHFHIPFVFVACFIEISSWLSNILLRGVLNVPSPPRMSAKGEAEPEKQKRAQGIKSRAVADVVVVPPAEPVPRKKG